MRIAICDKDPVFVKSELELLESVCNNTKTFRMFECFDNTEKLINRFVSDPYSFDIVIIYLGICKRDCIEKLRSINNDFRLIFVTDGDVSIYELFRYNISGIVARFMPEKLIRNEYERIISESLNEKKKYLIFETRPDVKLKLIISDILYFDIDNRRIRIHTADKIYFLKRTNFDSLKRFMQGYGFTEIHRSCLVNTASILSIDGNNLILENGQILSISRRLLKKTNRAFADVSAVGPALYGLSGMFV